MALRGARTCVLPVLLALEAPTDNQEPRTICWIALGCRWQVLAAHHCDGHAGRCIPIEPNEAGRNACYLGSVWANLCVHSGAIATFYRYKRHQIHHHITFDLIGINEE